MATTQQIGSKKVIENNQLNTCFVDGLKLSKRNDDLILVQLFSSMPNGVIEQSRSMMTKSFTKKLIDALSHHCDYFPTKTEEITD